MLMTYDAFGDYVEYLVDNEVPEVLLEELNGGIQISERDNLGKRIILYYGTFQYFYGGQPDEIWRDEVLKTVKHELRHHIEARAGQEDLARLERWEKEQRRRGQVMK